jgi:hypothetical protein
MLLLCVFIPLASPYVEASKELEHMAITLFSKETGAF